jgi:hypothetical protein
MFSMVVKNTNGLTFRREVDKIGIIGMHVEMYCKNQRVNLSCHKNFELIIQAFSGNKGATISLMGYDELSPLLSKRNSCL